MVCVRKTHTFYKNILNSDYDVVCLTETSLLCGVSTSELFSDDYSVFRRDRGSTASKKKDGGGVLIAVSKRFAEKQQVSWKLLGRRLMGNCELRVRKFPPLHCVSPTKRQ